MYTRYEMEKAIGQRMLLIEGEGLVHGGGIGQIRRVEHKGYVRYYGHVTQAGGLYLAGFSYSPDDRRISGFTCDCGACYAGRGGCVHTAALMLAVLEQEEAAPASAPSSRLLLYREEMAKRREKLRLEQLRLEQEEEQLRRLRIGSLIDEGYANRRAGVPREEKVGLHPMLSLEGTRLALELRVGISRLYVVRSLREFARRCELRECCVYGKELTFSHREEEFREQDAALLWQIVAMAQQDADGAKKVMTGAQLDQTMRLLIGREVDWRSADGKISRMTVEAGSRPLPVSIERQSRGYRMNVDAAHVVQGTAGTYFVLEEEGKILCALSGAHERIAPLVRLSAAFPQGALLEEDQLGAVCANLIAPAKDGVAITAGEEIICAHTPLKLITRFYIDIEDRNALTCRVEFDYGAARLAPGEENPQIRRDETAEETAMQAAARLFPDVREDGIRVFEGDDEACHELIRVKLRQLAACGEVMIAPSLMQMDVRKRSAMTIGVSVSEAGMLLVKADLGGLSQQELQAAYDAYRLKKKYVRLANGAFLSEEALEQAAEAAQTLESIDVTAEQAAEGVEVPASRAMYLETALKERKSIRLAAPKAAQDWIARLQRAQKTRAQNPETLRATLRDYQLEGLSWLTALSEAGFGGILADDMGLGKTMQALALLLSCQERGEAVRALVVCPASLQLNWENEAEKFAPTLRCCALMGGAKERLAAIAAQPAPQLLIVSYDQLRRDVQAYKDIQFTHIFLDEAQNIKNAASQAAKAVKTLKADHRFAMTGTPIENRLSELWSIFDFLMPGYLMTYKKFKDRFEMPIVREDDEKALQNLRMMTAPFILRRMKADVLDDLPEKVEKILTSEMTAEQRKLYQAHAAQLITKAEGGISDQKDRIRILAGLTRLRQICCDPRLCVEDYAGGSGKLEQCASLVRDMIAAGHRILLFSQFTSMLDLLKEALAAQGTMVFMLTGETDKQERMELVERFNDGGADVFLISLKAGGTGLNLTGADVVIHYDPWWNTSAQNQATDRAYRIGQKRGVQVIRLIADDTIESRILKLQQHKAELSDGVLSSQENLFNMDAQALRKLLK